MLIVSRHVATQVADPEVGAGEEHYVGEDSSSAVAAAAYRSVEGDVPAAESGGHIQIVFKQFVTAGFPLGCAVTLKFSVHVIVPIAVHTDMAADVLVHHAHVEGCYVGLPHTVAVEVVHVHAFQRGHTSHQLGCKTFGIGNGHLPCVGIGIIVHHGLVLVVAAQPVGVDTHAVTHRDGIGAVH